LLGFASGFADPGNSYSSPREDSGPFFMCGPGDPEGFLYRGSRRADGTRDGDQLALIEKLRGTGANCIYLMAVRSHGGDGDATQNPFVDNDPAKGLCDAQLDQWETWFAEMDAAGIVIYFIFYDDGSCVWDTGSVVGAAERSFIRALVDRFEHHDHLIWCVAEEYSEAYSCARVSALAAEIRAADDSDHVIAVHQTSGLVFDFPDDPNIDQFAIQYNVPTRLQLHAGAVNAWEIAAGRYRLNMAEVQGHGTGEEARKKNWACALAGAYVMVLGMDIASTPRSDLEDCGRLVTFMESTDFDRMAPHDELVCAGTEYVLAAPGESYIAYASALAGEMGLKRLTSGVYDVRWFDCRTGTTVEQVDVEVPGGDLSLPKPAGLGEELAVYVRRTGGVPVRALTWSQIKALYFEGD
jgi:hypothetical protein